MANALHIGRALSIPALIGVAAWAAGCAIGTPAGMSSSGLGGPKSRSTDLPPANLVPVRAASAGPVGAGAATPAALKRGTVIEVKDGETLLGIAQQHKVPVSVLVSENKLRDLNVFPGMRLLVPKL